MITVDSSEVFKLAVDMNASVWHLRRELTSANREIGARAVVIAQGIAPHASGALAASIHIIGRVSSQGVRVGTSLVYAWQREMGGTITGNPWLVFPGPNGRLVRVRSVHQTGSHYMAKTAAAIGPFAEERYARAVMNALKVG